MPRPFVPAQVRDRPPPLPPTPGRPTSLWQETLDEHRNTPGTDETPFGGVLILVAIGRVLAIPISLFSLARLWQTYSKPGLWTKLTSPDSPSYHPLWATAIVYELAGKVIVLLCCIALAWMFFTRRKAFRPAIVVYSVLLLAYLWGDHFLAAMLVGPRSSAPHDVAKLIGTTLGGLIWIPYYLISERMRQVFVR